MYTYAGDDGRRHVWISESYQTANTPHPPPSPPRWGGGGIKSACVQGPSTRKDRHEAPELKRRLATNTFAAEAESIVWSRRRDDLQSRVHLHPTLNSVRCSILRPPWSCLCLEGFALRLFRHDEGHVTTERERVVDKRKQELTAFHNP